MKKIWKWFMLVLRFLWNWIKDFIYCEGFYTGAFLIIFPVILDIARQDLREGMPAIGVWGIATQLFGLGVMFMGGRDSK